MNFVQASLLTVKSALRLARNGDEFFLLYVQLESSTPRAKVWYRADSSCVAAIAPLSAGFRETCT